MLGLWSNRTTPAPQVGNQGAIHGDSTRDGPVVQRPRHLAYTQETMVQLHPGPLTCPGTPIGRAAWLKPRRLRVRLQPWARLGRQPEDHLGLEPGMLWVRVPPGPLETHRPRGAAWSARLPVTQDDHPSGGARGSNPVEGARDDRGAVRKPAKRRSSNLRDLRVRLPPAPLDRTSVGWASASPTACDHRCAAVPEPARKAMQVQLLPGALDTARSSIGTGRWPLKPEGRVRFPHGPLSNMTMWWNWQTRDGQNVVPLRHWEFESPRGH